MGVGKRQILIMKAMTARTSCICVWLLSQLKGENLTVFQRDLLLSLQGREQHFLGCVNRGHLAVVHWGEKKNKSGLGLNEVMKGVKTV